LVLWAWLRTKEGGRLRVCCCRIHQGGEGVCRPAAQLGSVVGGSFRLGIVIFGISPAQRDTAPLPLWAEAWGTASQPSSMEGTSFPLDQAQQTAPRRRLFSGIYYCRIHARNGSRLAGKPTTPRRHPEDRPNAKDLAEMEGVDFGSRAVDGTSADSLEKPQTPRRHPKDRPNAKDLAEMEGYDFGSRAVDSLSCR